MDLQGGDRPVQRGFCSGTGDQYCTIQPGQGDDMLICYCDMLVMELTGKEEELKDDIETAMHHKDGTEAWVQMHKIIMMADNRKLNSQCVRKELFDEFTDQYPYARKYLTSTRSGKRMRHYCRFRGFHFNPNKPNEEGMDFDPWLKLHPDEVFEGETDKSGGREYRTITTDKWTGRL